ncbi:riboflavin synthase [Clostridiisalibacter paucivorans]|uniref:riboflavin synthase n=1 Tax=Clostridiisalibacter paucivorans TaxID=408753 RepID=UPI000479CC1D|nr:riboflavin synthase [Clostridiisalibacter paucivorans]
MFTGIVEEIGVVKFVTKGHNSIKIGIGCEKVLEDVKVGDSISTNGVCLTVFHYEDYIFYADVMPETMDKSNLNFLNVGNRVNLERALRIGDRLGGHMVSGHIDGMGKIVSRVNDDNATWVEIKVSQDMLKYIVNKGSIAIDGISLTVAYVDKDSFKVSIIPTTAQDTILLTKGIGDYVNIECDMIGKYVEKIMGYQEYSHDKKEISMDLLRENGFV